MLSVIKQRLSPDKKLKAAITAVLIGMSKSTALKQQIVIETLERDDVLCACWVSLSVGCCFLVVLRRQGHSYPEAPWQMKGLMRRDAESRSSLNVHCLCLSLLSGTLCDRVYKDTSKGSEMLRPWHKLMKCPLARQWSAKRSNLCPNVRSCVPRSWSCKTQ